MGANFFAMHYQNNQNAFTHGMGGYFSPQGYFLANVPFTWAGHYINRWHYNVMGALGVQAFQENSAPLWPLAGDKPLETAQNNPMLPNITTVSGNYDVRSQIAYQFSPHWFVGGYIAANNSRDYTYTSVGFFVRFMFREQPSTATTPPASSRGTACAPSACRSRAASAWLSQLCHPEPGRPPRGRPESKDPRLFLAPHPRPQCEILTSGLTKLK